MTEKEYSQTKYKTKKDTENDVSFFVFINVVCLILKLNEDLRKLLGRRF